MSNDPKKKKKYDKNGYHTEIGRRIPPNDPPRPPNPPIENEMQIYVNPNNPNDYIYLDAGIVEFYDIPMEPNSTQIRAPIGPLMEHQMEDKSEIDEDLLRLRRVIKNTKNLCERRVKTT